MEVVNNIEQFNCKDYFALTMGTFDGIHLGHQSIIKRLIDVSKREKIKTILLTFSPHPQAVVKSKKTNDIKILTTIKEKISILKNYNLDYLVVIKFTENFSKITSSEFIEDFLVNKFNVKEIVIGYDHAFGKERGGSIETLRELSEKFKYNVSIVEPVKYNDESISSTRIREALKNGNISSVSEMLGRNYLFSGNVVKGRGIGKIINVPTANIKIDDESKLIPKKGIYVVKILLRKKIYKGLLNIGTNPTVNSHCLSIEANIFDFYDNIYDEKVTVEVIKRLRDEKKFENIESLVQQIHKDKEECIKFFNKCE